MQSYTKHTAPNVLLSALPYILAAVVFVALTLMQNAKAMDGNNCADFQNSHMQHGAPFPPTGMMEEYPHMDMKRSPFEDIGLSDAQQKKITELMKAQSGNICEKEKAVHETMHALYQLASSEPFDEAKAKALAEAHGKAVAEVAYLHAESQSRIWAVLTKEQRKLLEEKRPKAPRK